MTKRNVVLSPMCSCRVFGSCIWVGEWADGSRSLAKDY